MVKVKKVEGEDVTSKVTVAGSNNQHVNNDNVGYDDLSLGRPRFKMVYNIDDGSGVQVMRGTGYSHAGGLVVFSGSQGVAVINERYIKIIK